MHGERMDSANDWPKRALRTGFIVMVCCFVWLSLNLLAANLSLFRMTFPIALLIFLVGGAIGLASLLIGSIATIFRGVDL